MIWNWAQNLPPVCMLFMVKPEEPGPRLSPPMQDHNQLKSHGTYCTYGIYCRSHCIVEAHQCCIEFHRWRSTSHAWVWTRPAAPCVQKSSCLRWSSAASTAIWAFATRVWSNSGYNMVLKSVLSALKRALGFHINHVKHMEIDWYSSVWLIWSLSARAAKQRACIWITECIP